MKGNAANFLSFNSSFILCPFVLKVSSTEGYLNRGSKSTSAPLSSLWYCYSMGEWALNSQQEYCVTCSLIHPQGIDLFCKE
jgi:hypothetical protein